MITQLSVPAPTRLMVVEDEAIIGRYLQHSLENLGFQVVSLCISGEEAIRKAAELQPDLILMDISLQDDLDGVEVARRIQAQNPIPIIYITAYTDPETLDRARSTNPYGYILKPFDDRSLQIAVNLALHRYDLEMRLRKSESLFRMVMEHQGEGVVIADTDENLVFANPAASEIFGAPVEELTKMNMRDFTSEEVFQFIRNQVPSRRAGERSVYDIQIIRPDGEKRDLVVTATPWFDEQDHFSGSFGIFHDITERNRAIRNERDQRALAEALRDSAAALNSTLELNDVFDRILTNIDLVVPHEAANIMLIEGDMACVKRSRGYAEHNVAETIAELAYNFHQLTTLSEMYRNGKPVFIADTHTAGGWAVDGSSAWIRSYAGAPIIVQGQVVGFINVDSAQPNFFTETHAERLKAFADQAATAIRNAQLFSEVERHVLRLSQFNTLTHTALRASSLAELLDDIALQLSKIFQSADVYIYIAESQDDQPAYAAHTLRNPSTPSLHGQYQRMALQAMNFHSAQVITPPVQSAADIPSKTVLGLPLIRLENTLGAVLIGYAQTVQFTADQLLELEGEAAQVALAVARVRLLEMENQKSLQLLHANHLITALAHVATRLDAAPSLESVFDVLGIEMEQLGIHCLLALAVPPKNASFRVRYISIFQPSGDVPVLNLQTDPVFINLSRSPLFDDLVQARQPVFHTGPIQEAAYLLPGINALYCDQLPTALPADPTTHSMFLPLVAGKELTGLLILWGAALKPQDISAMSVFASQVAITIENTRLYNEVQRLAITDELTTLYNRRGLFELAYRELERARRFKRPLSAVMLDADHFKEINDTYGHPVGDQVLRQLALRLNENIREIDLIGRYGGDEFVIIMPETSLEDAACAAERLRENLVAQPIYTENAAFKLAISLGVTHLLPTDTSLETTLKRADRALYQAKQNGRNRVVTIDRE